MELQCAHRAAHALELALAPLLDLFPLDVHAEAPHGEGHLRKHLAGNGTAQQGSRGWAASHRLSPPVPRNEVSIHCDPLGQDHKVVNPLAALPALPPISSASEVDKPLGHVLYCCPAWRVEQRAACLSEHLS